MLFNCDEDKLLIEVVLRALIFCGVSPLIAAEVKLET